MDSSVSPGRILFLKIISNLEERISIGGISRTMVGHRAHCLGISLCLRLALAWISWAHKPIPTCFLRCRIRDIWSCEQRP